MITPATWYGTPTVRKIRSTAGKPGRNAQAFSETCPSLPWGRTDGYPETATK